MEPGTPTPNAQPGFAPSGPLSAGDDAALKAIEALESETNILDSNLADDPIPALDAVPLQPAPTPIPTPAPVSLPITTMQAPVAPVAPTPVATPVVLAPVAQITPMPIATAAPIAPTAAPVVAVPAPNSIAAALNQSLQEDPAPAAPSSDFQPFAAQKKKTKKSTVILLIVVILLVLGAGGYFGWQYFQTQNAPTAPVVVPETIEEGTSEDVIETGDTETSINQTITDITGQIDGMDDTNYADSTLSDDALYN